MAPVPPELAIRSALDAAYSSLFSEHIPRSQIIGALRSFIAADPGYAAEAARQRVALTQLVEARSVGERCGCHISKSQLALLSEALDTSNG